MAKAPVAADAAQQDKRKSSTDPRTAPLYIAIGIATLLLLLGNGAGLLGQQLASEHVSAHIAALQVDRQHAQVEQALSDWRDALSSTASDPVLTATLQTGDMAAINTMEQSLRLRFPGALGLELVPLGPLGVAGIRTEDIPNTSVLELNLITRALNDEEHHPEALKQGTDVAIALVQPVRDSQKRAVGAILLRQPASALQARLKRLDGNAGQTRLVQKFNQSELLIAQEGDASGAQTAERVMNGGRWSLSFNPSPTALAQVLPPLWPLLITSVLWALGLFGVIFLIHRKLNNIYRDDIAKLKQLLVSLVARPDSTAPQFALASFNELGEAAVAVGRRALTGAAVVTNAKVGAQPAGATIEVIEETAPPPLLSLPDQIFRAYDIRGRVSADEITPELAQLIGRAIGSEAQDLGQRSVAVARDGRLSSPALADALTEGLLESGVDVLDLGQVPTPLLYFSTHNSETQSGVMVTGSHNPKDQNGFKIAIGGHTLSGGEITALRDRIAQRNFRSGKGTRQVVQIEDDYINHIIADIAIAQPLKVVLDAGNGVAGAIAPRLFSELGCEVVPLFCEVDGHFPNHHPDPSVPANLQALIERVQAENADLGVAFDGDGDRLAVVTRSGQIIPADRLLMLFAKDVVSRNPGADVLFDVKCTRRLNGLVSSFGGRPIMWKSGHSYMKEKMRETGALLGGEFSGHIFFLERWFGFDDGLYTAARLVEIISISGADLEDLMATFPDSVSTPELRIPAPEADKFRLIEALASRGQFDDGKLNTLDGLRVDFSDGWGLARASNTEAAITLRFEADTSDALSRIQAVFREQIQTLAPGLKLPF